MPCPLPFFFGSFESSIVSLVGFLLGQPVEGGHACSQYRHCLPSVGQALTLDAFPPWARMGALRGLSEMFWACRRPWTGQLCSWRPWAWAWQGQVSAHTAQTCPGLHFPEALPYRPQKTLESGMPPESAAWQGLLSLTSWCGGRVVWTRHTVHPSDLRGWGCRGDVGPLSGQASTFHQSRREEEATFTEHPLGPGHSEESGTRHPCFHGAPRGVGAVRLVGTTETEEPCRSGAGSPQDPTDPQWASWGRHYCPVICPFV